MNSDCADKRFAADGARPIVLRDSDYRGRPRCPDDDDDDDDDGNEPLTVWQDPDESRSRHRLRSDADDDDDDVCRQRYGAAYDVVLGGGSTDGGSAAATRFAECACVDAWARLKRIFELTDEELEKTRGVQYAYPGDECGPPADGSDDDDDDDRFSGETLEDYPLDGEYLFADSDGGGGGGVKTSAKTNDGGETEAATGGESLETARPGLPRKKATAPVADSANGQNETAKNGGAAMTGSAGASSNGKKRGAAAAVDRQSNGGGSRRNAESSGKGTPDERPKAGAASAKKRPPAVCCSAYGSTADNGRAEKENNMKYVYTFGEEYRGGVSYGHKDCVDCLIRVPRHKGWMSAEYVAKQREKASERQRPGATPEQRERTQHGARTAVGRKRDARASNVTAASNHSAASIGDGDARRAPAANTAVVQQQQQQQQQQQPPPPPSSYNGLNNNGNDREVAAAVELRKSNGAYTITMNAMTADGQMDAAAEPIVFRLGAPADADGPSSASSFDVGFVPPAAIRALRPPKTRRDACTAYNRDDFMPAERRKVERKMAASPADAARERHRS